MSTPDRDPEAIEDAADLAAFRGAEAADDGKRVTLTQLLAELDD